MVKLNLGLRNSQSLIEVFGYGWGPIPIHSWVRKASVLLRIGFGHSSH